MFFALLLFDVLTNKGPSINFSCTKHRSINLTLWSPSIQTCAWISKEGCSEKQTVPTWTTFTESHFFLTRLKWVARFNFSSFFFDKTCSLQGKNVLILPSSCFVLFFFLSFYDYKWHFLKLERNSSLKQKSCRNCETFFPFLTFTPLEVSNLQIFIRIFLIFKIIILMKTTNSEIRHEKGEGGKEEKGMVEIYIWRHSAFATQLRG